MAPELFGRRSERDSDPLDGSEGYSFDVPNISVGVLVSDACRSERN